MDIERLSQIGSTLDTRLKKKREDEKKRTGKTSSLSFKRTLDKVSLEQPALEPGRIGASFPGLSGSETLEELLDNVHEAGERLRRDPVLGPLDEYKKAVRRFLKYILIHATEVDESLGIRNPRTLQQKKYVVIRVIDKKLESLAAHVLRNQAEQLDILRRIEEIEGMLVDLTG
ncbi:MAG: hypothetical protein CSA76_03210 [Spirochaetales bacterium]|nr:MAG: hypothetical protein CSA76_03210 [Spirochaetales bacterium]